MRAKKVGIGIISLVICVVAIYISIASRYVLVADDEIFVDNYPDPRRIDGNKPLRKLHRGERASVLSCDDLKSYIGIHVRLPSGDEGYVIEGKYKLETSPWWNFSSSSPGLFSCEVH